MKTLMILIRRTTFHNRRLLHRPTPEGMAVAGFVPASSHFADTPVPSNALET
jgi:hypothetical protein